MQVDHGVVACNGWYGIAAQFEGGTLTLNEWLNRNDGRELRSREAIEGVLGSLFFGKGLGAGYAPVKLAKDEDTNIFQLLLPRGLRRLKILAALADLGRLAVGSDMLPQTTWQSHLQRVNAMLASDNAEHIDGVNHQKFSGNFVKYKCHGDLHCGNVLVTDVAPHTAIIIDTADFGSYHWATDVARLTVDLFLHGCPCDWRPVDLEQRTVWCEELRSFVNGDHYEPRVELGAYGHALGWLARNLRVVLPVIGTDNDFKKHRWELRLAIACELFRTSYRNHWLWTKRFLAVVVALSLLEDWASEKEITLE
jgi:hypothetical protein